MITQERNGESAGDVGYTLLTVTGEDREAIGTRIASRVYDEVQAGRAPFVERLLEYIEPPAAWCLRLYGESAPIAEFVERVLREGGF